MLSPGLIVACVAAYFSVLLGIAWWTGRRAGNAAYFLGNRASPWYVVAFGLIGDSLSGVTFVSVPGRVRDGHYGYLQVVLGYAVGYLVISHLLLPVFYRLQVTSIYSYLEHRLGIVAQRTGAAFFLLSRLLGAAARLYLAADIAQTFVLDAWNIPSWAGVTGIILLILLYTYRGGIKTLVWTDTFQSLFLLLGLLGAMVSLSLSLGQGPGEWWTSVTRGPFTRIFEWDWTAPGYFGKEFLGGIFIAICMTGLDQNMMQKNLSCRSLVECQRNLHGFAVIVVAVNFLFVALGSQLYAFAEAHALATPARSDLLFPTLAFHHVGGATAILFLLGLTASTFSSADSVLTTLTTSFCIDILGMERRHDLSEADRLRWRHRFHLAFAVLLLVTVLIFNAVANAAVIALVLKIAAYTYGPLLGLFAFSLLTPWAVRPAAVPWIALAAPAACALFETLAPRLLGGYRVGHELLILNGALTFAGLWLARRPTAHTTPPTRIG